MIAELSNTAKSMGDSGKIKARIDLHGWCDSESGTLKTGVEVGVHRGELSAALLAYFKDLTLYMVDSWTTHDKSSPYRKSGDGLSKLSNDQQVENAVAARKAVEFAGSRARIMWMQSHVAASAFNGQRVSFVFIDADHSYEGVKADLEAWYPIVERGGLICGHDYLHKREIRNGAFGVKRAVDEFAVKHGLDVKVHGTVWWATKP